MFQFRTNFILTTAALLVPLNVFILREYTSDMSTTEEVAVTTTKEDGDTSISGGRDDVSYANRTGIHDENQEEDRIVYDFPINITSFQQLENVNLKVPLPENLNVVIVGDSLSRYLYISLAYFLKFGTWINMKHPLPVAKNESISKMYKQESAREAVPHLNLIWKNFFDSKEEFTASFGAIMSPLDVCDCVGSNAKRWSKKFGVDEVWNRYFRQPSRKNSITFYGKPGDKNNLGVPIEFKSTWALEGINKHNEEAMLQTYNGTMHYNQSTEIKYATANWTEFILDFVAQMEPKPTAFVFNQGLWPHEDFKEPKVYKSIISAISKAGMISIYKTTTKMVGSNDTTLAPYERGICDLADHCLDLSWTALVPNYLYADPGHFFEPVYSWMNIQMLDMLFTAT